MFVIKLGSAVRSGILALNKATDKSDGRLRTIPLPTLW